jgi:arabinogalactan endo-1,4-beta-galactosidase
MFCFLHCKEDTKNIVDPPETKSDFYFGADLSYVNQILDHGGVYKDGGSAQSPYKIFKDHGTNLVRLRLWHNPTWTKTIYGADGKQLYNDLADVERAVRLSKEQGLSVLLDFHYSDSWTDPGKQEIPLAWRDIKDIGVLKDSVYQYTLKTLKHLDGKGLMPELVQIGNETNCGLLYSNAVSGFPGCNVCTDGQWARLGEVINSAIQAVNEVVKTSFIKTKVILHVADPKNIEWWFDNVTGTGKVTGFDIIGISYYPIWHTTVTVDKLSDKISTFKNKYAKDVIILETAYPWTIQGDDGYNNIFGSQPALSGYPYSQQGQYDMITAIAQEVMDGGGKGVIYWEPAWITSATKDLWGTGSSWENNAFFDFEGNTTQGMDYTKHSYK